MGRKILSFFLLSLGRRRELGSRGKLRLHWVFLLLHPVPKYCLIERNSLLDYTLLLTQGHKAGRGGPGKGPTCMAGQKPIISQLGWGRTLGCASGALIMEAVVYTYIQTFISLIDLFASRQLQLLHVRYATHEHFIVPTWRYCAAEKEAWSFTIYRKEIPNSKINVQP